MALECFNEIVAIGYASDTINGIEVANALYGRGCAQFCLFNLSDAMKSLNESLNWKVAALGEDDPGLACIFYQSEKLITTPVLFALLFLVILLMHLYFYLRKHIAVAHVYLEQSEKEDAIMCFEEYSRLLKIGQFLHLLFT